MSAIAMSSKSLVGGEILIRRACAAPTAADERDLDFVSLRGGKGIGRGGDRSRGCGGDELAAGCHGEGLF